MSGILGIPLPRSTIKKELTFEDNKKHFGSLISGGYDSKDGICIAGQRLGELAQINFKSQLTKINSVKEEVAKLNKKAEALEKEKIPALRIDIDKNTATLSAQAERIKSLEATVKLKSEALEKHVKESEKSITNLTTKLTEEKTKRELLEVEFKGVKKNFEDFKKRMEDLTAKFVTTSDFTAATKEIKLKQKESNDNLAQQVLSVEQDLSALKDRVDQNKSEMLIQINQHQLLLVSLQRDIAGISLIKGQIKLIQEIVKNLESSQKTTNSKLSEIKQEVRQIESNLKTVQKDLSSTVSESDFEKAIKGLTGEISSIQSQMDETENQLIKFESQLSSNLEIVSKIDAKVKKDHSTIKQTQSGVKEIEDKLKQEHALVLEAKKNVKELEDKIKNKHREMSEKFVEVQSKLSNFEGIINQMISKVNTQSATNINLERKINQYDELKQAIAQIKQGVALLAQRFQPAGRT